MGGRCVGGRASVPLAARHHRLHPSLPAPQLLGPPLSFPCCLCVPIRSAVALPAHPLLARPTPTLPPCAPTTARRGGLFRAAPRPRPPPPHTQTHTLYRVHYNPPSPSAPSPTHTPAPPPTPKHDLDPPTCLSHHPKPPSHPPPLSAQRLGRAPAHPPSPAPSHPWPPTHHCPPLGTPPSSTDPPPPSLPSPLPFHSCAKEVHTTCPPHRSRARARADACPPLQRNGCAHPRMCGVSLPPRRPSSPSHSYKREEPAPCVARVTDDDGCTDACPRARGCSGARRPPPPSPPHPPLPPSTWEAVGRRSPCCCRMPSSCELLMQWRWQPLQ